jgi:hypothetical protein
MKKYRVSSESRFLERLGAKFFTSTPVALQHLVLSQMPRSATDATRFTSTTPYAASKPPPNLPNLSRNHTPPRTPGPPGETPQEKVKRLRAAADRARFEKIDPIDKWIVRGRVWADRAHRFTALSLIGISGMKFLGQLIHYARNHEG